MNEDKKGFWKISGTVAIVTLLFIAIFAIPKTNLTRFLEVTASGLDRFSSGANYNANKIIFSKKSSLNSKYNRDE